MSGVYDENYASRVNHLFIVTIEAGSHLTRF